MTGAARPPRPTGLGYARSHALRDVVADVRRRAGRGGPAARTGSGSTAPTNGQAELQEKIVPLLVVALILGLVSTFIEPVIKLLSLPFIILTLGLPAAGHQRADADAHRPARRRLRPRLPRRRLLERARRRADRDHRRLGRPDGAARPGLRPVRAPRAPHARQLPHRAGLPGQHLPLPHGPRRAGEPARRRRARRPRRGRGPPAPAAGTSATRWTAAPRPRSSAAGYDPTPAPRPAVRRHLARGVRPGARHGRVEPGRRRRAHRPDRAVPRPRSGRSGWRGTGPVLRWGRRVRGGAGDGRAHERCDRDRTGPSAGARDA